jgi:hypothetical protein
MEFIGSPHVPADQVKLAYKSLFKSFHMVLLTADSPIGPQSSSLLPKSGMTWVKSEYIPTVSCPLA